MTKEKKVYYLLVVSFVLFISVFISTFLVRNIYFEGETIVKRKYYELVYNIKDDRLSIKNDVISVKLNNIEEKLSFDIVNAGNIDVVVKNVDVNIINTNLNREALDIKLNLNKGDYIKGGEQKKVYISVNYDDKLDDESFLDLKVKYSFGE